MSKKNGKKVLVKNGGILLEELITSFNGKSNPIRCFSSEEILKATNNFDESHVISRRGYFIWCKGIIQDRPVLIKKWSIHDLSIVTEVYRDISVSSQMNNHNNVLKILGCCLEFDLPALVCKYTEHGPLNRNGNIASGDALPWNVRLKIAKEIANVVSYLHTAFPKTIVHRNINPTNIFLDSDWKAKLSDFWLCVEIPEGELYVEDDVKGVIGFIDPAYYWTMKVTEKVDVYSFGVLMMVLLSGRAAVFDGPDGNPTSIHDHVSELLRNGGSAEIIDPAIREALDSGDTALQVEAFLRLALRCISYNKEEPMTGMTEVAKELRLIQKYTQAPL